ncbi:family 76 glycoside hydrolase [Melampsora larici-populina 98AG31]|uniref:Mannan endo-1,6-alpha-mannosidase n=1 Tax=Melampsora larici-populina (strain 98AG31 / pathotype 3-4-7) TaxID=747676 RepID=F4RPE2_MELLP|nr:family 76 glycoside hydrolase [Melampsora larici-populina 98AG31]EGG05863.1 family 76 glycoside hydrolase [Melampsora larici-populina 98AG31]
MAKSCLLSGLLALGLAFSAHGASYSPTLNVNDVAALRSAATAALKNLLTYYVPTSVGAFPQEQTPWHESQMIWGLYMDHAKYTGDTQFLDIVTGALVNATYGSNQDFLGGSMAGLSETLLGKWNDDILWGSLAAVGGAEIYGPNSVMPGANGPWITPAQKTYDQAFEQWDAECGGGIYWSRDRNGKSAPYKSLITQLEFIMQGARNYLQTKNETALALSKQTFDWVISSGLGNTQTGVLADGMNAGACGSFTSHVWSYNYGQLLGAMAWMHKATNNQTFLDLMTPFYQYATTTFNGQNTSGVVTETCEPNAKCNRDQQGFKANYVRNLAYVYRETNNGDIKEGIKKTLDTSIQAMVQNSCDQEWNCGGNWTTDTQPIKYVRSQHVSAALLVAALGVHDTSTGAGLLTKVTAGALSDTTNGAAGLGGSGTKNPGKITSQKLGAAAGLDARACQLVMLLGVLLSAGFLSL